jgi:hypothetical protein
VASFENILTHRLSSKPYLEYEDLVRRIRAFTISDFLKMTNTAARWLLETELRRTLTPVPVLRKYKVLPDSAIYIGPWTLAFLAKTSLLHSSERMHGWLKVEDLIGLAYMYENLRDANSETEITCVEDIYGILMRMRWEQLGYQEDLYHLIPRAKIMFVDAKALVSDDTFDLDSLWKESAGLSIQKFLAVGFAYFAGATKQPVLSRYYAASGVMSERLSTSDCDRFLERTATTFDEFKQLSLPLRARNPLYVKTELNLLLQRPLVISPKSEILCPIPQLIPFRVTDGILHDIANSMPHANRTDFFRLFGRLFEEYVGILLRQAFPAEDVFREPVYGSGPNRWAGPDWIVIEGDTALLFECRSSRLTLETRTYGDIESIRSDFRRIFLDTLEKFPTKVEHIRRGLTSIDPSRIKSYEPIVLLYEPVAFEKLYRAIANAELPDLAGLQFQYSLMDISALELLTGWVPGESICVLLREARNAYLSTEVDFGDFLIEWANERGLSRTNPFFDSVLNEFFGTEFGVQLPDRRP